MHLANTLQKNCQALKSHILWKKELILMYTFGRLLDGFVHGNVSNAWRAAITTLSPRKAAGKAVSQFVDLHHHRFRSQMSFTQGSYRVLDSWKSFKIWKPIFQPGKSLENEDKLWKMVNSLECLFSFSKLHCNLILYICMSSWENIDSFFVLVSFYRFIDNALSGKESSVLEKVRWKS